MFNPIILYEFGKTRKQFVSTWKTDNTSAGSSTTTQVKLPLVSNGTYNMRVDWGDGTSNIITVWNAAATTHTYSIAGTYTIKISGTCNGWSFSLTGDRLKILTITEWGVLKLTNYVSHFSGCANLTLTTVKDIIDLSLCTSMFQTFYSCTSITTINRISEWNVSSITSMQLTFFSCTLFNQNIGSWNTALVTNMSYMFYNATAFNQNIGSWNISNVTSFTSFLLSKTPATFSIANLDAIYNGWSALPSVKPSIVITFGTAKYTAASTAGRAILTGAPNNWAITDGGL